jgi:hypothetical protein
MPASEIPEGYTREALLTAARSHADVGAELLRREEEGYFKFYALSELVDLVTQRGFVAAKSIPCLGNPGQAGIVVCQKL